MARTYRTLSLSLPPEAASRLEERGRSRGKSAARVAAELVLATLSTAWHDEATIDDLRAENARLWDENAELRRRPLRTFDQLAADRLADEVAVLVHRRFLDSRSPAGDALLDYRDPPSSSRADRMASLENQIAQIEAKLSHLEAESLARRAESLGDE